MNKAIIYILLAVSVFIAIGLPLYFNQQKKKLADQLTSLLINGNYKEFRALAASQKARQYIHPFNLEYLKLNSGFMQNDNSIINESLSNLSSIKLNNSQRQTIYSSAFYYFVSVKNKSETNKYYELLKQTDNLKSIEPLEMTYDTYVLGGAKYLDRALELVNTLPEDQRVPIESLLVDMYRNLGDEKSASEYEKLLRSHLSK